MHVTMLVALLIAPLGVDASGTGADGRLQDAIQVIRQTGPGGRGSEAAARAWRELAAADVGRLPTILTGMDGASPLACNWLRSAIDNVLERARSNQSALPAKELESFLRDSRHHPQARRLAYELLVEADKRAADRLLPGMIDDPSPELRRDAVARLLNQAEKLTSTDKKAEALPILRRAFAAARDKQQIDQAARGLRKLGEKIDLATHLGMVLDWKLIGPFPNLAQKGVQTAYPPEKEIDLRAAYESKSSPSGKVRWSDHVSKQEYGVVDLNAALGAHTEVLAYAYTEFTSPKDRSVEIRLGCYTAFKLWVNGELVLDRGDAYTGMDFDHYAGTARLKTGKNTFLIKVCQDNPPPGVPRLWRFQLRVCDDSGVAVLSTTRPSPASPGKDS